MRCRDEDSPAPGCRAGRTGCCIRFALSSPLVYYNSLTMDRKLCFYLVDIALYPLLVCILIPLSLPGVSVINSSVEVSFWLGPCIAFWLVSIVIARLWLRAAWHAMLAFAVGVGLASVIEVSPALVKACLLRPYEEPYESGALHIKGTRVRGINHGVFTYYTEDGRIRKTETWTNGRMEGEYRSYYENGTLAGKGMKKRDGQFGLCDDDLLDVRYGRWEFYREDGMLDDVRVYDENRVVRSEKYELCRIKSDDDKYRICRLSDRLPFTGDIEKKAVFEEFPSPYLYTAHLVDGMVEGEWLCHYDSPGYPLASKGTIRKGYAEGAFTAFHPNGQIRSEETYRHGRLEGDYTVYYADSVAVGPKGRLQYHGTYADGELSGVVRRWHPNGVLATEAVYVNGKRHGAYRCYDEQKRLVEEAFYRNDKKHGHGKTYRGDGGYTDTEYYEGELIVKRDYYPDGRLKSVWTPSEDSAGQYDADGHTPDKEAAEAE